MDAPDRMRIVGPRARWVMGLITGALLVEAVVGAYSLACLVGSFDEDYFAWAGRFELPIFIAAAVAWLVWQHDSHRRLASMSDQKLGFTPAWAVGWWFIPLAQLVQPYRAVTELWTATIPGASTPSARLGPVPILPAWWACFLGGNLASRVAAIMMVSGDEDAALVWVVTAAVALCTAAVLAIAVVRGVESRLRGSATYATETASATALLAAGGSLVGAIVGAAVWVLGREASDELFDFATASVGDALYGVVAAVLVGVIVSYLAMAVSGRPGIATAVPAAAGSLLALLIGKAVLGDLSTRVGLLIDDADIPMLTGAAVFTVLAALVAGAIAMMRAPMRPWVLGPPPEAGDDAIGRAAASS